MTRYFSATAAMFAMWAALAPLARAQETRERIVSWGTLLHPDTVVTQARNLARSLANPDTSTWRATGDQKRKYRFPEANATINYRIVIPPTWDGTSKLPMLVFLHSGGANENTNLDANNKQLVNLAIEHGYALVSPLGHQGAYGFHLRLPAVFGQQTSANQQIAAVTSTAERTNQLSEMDVINVIEIVLNEYPIDRNRMFLAGHSMGAGGTWYLGSKYPDYWAALAPLSGPFVHVEGYPWETIRPLPVFVSEGDNTASTAASRAVHAYMAENGFKVTYKEVQADHEGMIALVLADMFTFFNENPKTTAISPGRSHAQFASPQSQGVVARYTGARTLRITLPSSRQSSHAEVVIVNSAGTNMMTGRAPVVTGEAVVNDVILPLGIYHARIRTGDGVVHARFMVVR